MKLSSKYPISFAKYQVTSLSTNFRASTSLVEVAAPLEVKPTEIIVRNKFVGINASDVNYSAGAYRPSVQPPFDCGFEAVGTVVGLGANVKQFSLHQPVITQHFGAFSEFQVVPTRNARALPAEAPKYLGVDLSGATASLALEHCAQPLKGEVALVTAAAGATGHFAVQLLKQQYGCHVIGTCGSESKAEFLRSIGCDRPVNYKTENLDDVLRREYRSGVNIVYESVGGAMFDTALAHLSTKGRLVVLGNISGYHDGSSFGKGGVHEAHTKPIGTTLLQKSASVRGFFLPHFQKYAGPHVKRLTDMVESGAITSAVDPKVFRGIGHIPDAVEYLHSGRTSGKVYVDMYEAMFDA